jgi:hypothetical protein
MKKTAFSAKSSGIGAAAAARSIREAAYRG